MYLLPTNSESLSEGRSTEQCLSESLALTGLSPLAETMFSAEKPRLTVTLLFTALLLSALLWVLVLGWVLL